VFDMKSIYKKWSNDGMTKFNGGL